VGDPDLSSGQGSAQRPSVGPGRGLVVFPAPERPRHQAVLVRYAPLLITLALGVVLVLVVALVR
jgi:hypothetical protein